MSELVRLSFSIDQQLNDKLSALLERTGYENRSEFIRDLVRDRLVQSEWEEDDVDALGTIMLVYNHEIRHLSDKLTELQHQHHHAILATTHLHVDRHNCAEMIMVRGKPRIIREIADGLRQQKGVLHADLLMSALGEHLS
ncbi:MAG: putative nickel-responsive regulator [Phycisphaerae bacterium]|nr:MAG: putative nickel-responsive regulator [Phycisphaerae bacterium]